MPNSPLPALIFDFDGTLIESAPELASCLNALLAEDGRAPLTQAQVEDMIGNGNGRCMNAMLCRSTGSLTPKSSKSASCISWMEVTKSCAIAIPFE